MLKETVDHSYWLDKWKAEDIKFHQDDFHPQLLRHFTSIPKGKVLVPLCGKSRDMIWIRSQGHQVVGVELSPIACESFFSENKIDYARNSSGEYPIFEGNGIQLWCGDFFRTRKKVWNEITSIYDRAALIAFSSEERKKYADYINKGLEYANSNLRMLLISVEYPQDKVQGPPFSVLESEIHALYGKYFKIERVDRYADNILTGRHPKFMDTQVSESVYLLTRHEGD